MILCVFGQNFSGYEERLPLTAWNESNSQANQFNSGFGELFGVETIRIALSESCKWEPTGGNRKASIDASQLTEEWLLTAFFGKTFSAQLLNVWEQNSFEAKNESSRIDSKMILKEIEKRTIDF